MARHAFAELVERASACDRIRGVLALIKRHENLFRLPTRIRHATERGLYDQVMCPYHHLSAHSRCAEHALPPVLSCTTSDIHFQTTCHAQP